MGGAARSYMPELLQGWQKPEANLLGHNDDEPGANTNGGIVRSMDSGLRGNDVNNGAHMIPLGVADTIKEIVAQAIGGQIVLSPRMTVNEFHMTKGSGNNLFLV